MQIFVLSPDIPHIHTALNIWNWQPPEREQCYFRDKVGSSKRVPMLVFMCKLDLFFLPSEQSLPNDVL